VDGAGDTSQITFAVLFTIGVFAAMAAITALFVVVCRFLIKLMRRLGDKFLGVAPPPLAKAGLFAAGVARFFYLAALFGGLTAFGIALAILHSSVPADLQDPVLRNPLLWLTWLGVMAALFICGIVGGLVLRVVLVALFARRRESISRKEP
jgi:hypothetical protein